MQNQNVGVRLGRFIVPVIVFAMYLVYSGVYSVPEGHVGMIYQYGALTPGAKPPGVHLRFPFVTTVSVVDLRLQTDVVTEIPCGTKGGVMIYFDKIEVVNKLAESHAWQTVKTYGEDYDRTWIFDKIHHEINQFCSSHSLAEVYIEKFDILDESLTKALQADCDKYDVGVQIITARVTKPRIPPKIRENYEKMEEHKTRLRVVEEEAKVVERDETSKSNRALIAAQREKEVAAIEAAQMASVARIDADRELSISTTKVQQKIAEKEGAAKISEIESSMLLKREKALADSRQYAIRSEAEAMSLRLTPAFLRYTLYQSLSNNTAIIYGTSIPQSFMPWANKHSSDSNHYF